VSVCRVNVFMGRLFNGAAAEIRSMLDIAILLTFGIAAPILGSIERSNIDEYFWS
jgi:hypothetical protein